RFEQNIVRQGLAATAFTGLIDYLGASVVYAGIFPNFGEEIEPAADLIRQEFDAVIENGVTEAELERVKTQIKIGAITAFRDSALGTAEFLQNSTLYFDDPNAISQELAQYEAVTLDDIQRVAQTYLCDQPQNIIITLPDGEPSEAEYPGPLVEPIEIDPSDEPSSEILTIDVTDEVLADLPEGVISRETVPAALPVTETEFPPFETFSLDNGLEVIFVEQTEVPEVNLELFVGGSNAAAPQDKQEVADIMAELLTKGTTTRTAAQIAETIEAVGGGVGSSAALEWTSLSVNAPSTEARLAFSLLADMARRSTFPQEELDVIKEQTLTFLEQAEVNPDTLANRQFGRLAYGGHPYGYYSTRETVENLSRADVLDFYNTFWKPNNALLVIVGDLTVEEAQAHTERVFQWWRPGEVPDFLDYPEAQLGDTSVIYVVDRPDSEQATIQIGNRGINARNPDRYAVTVMNTVLGSGASSRLFDNLREDKGYTYGIFSRFGQPNDTSTFRVLSDVDQEHAADAIIEILAELDRIRTEPISEQELIDAKGLLIGGFALSIEEPADFANRLASRYLTNVPIEELTTYLQSLEQVTAADALAAAATYIDTEAPIIVVVGESEILVPQLEPLGEVVVVDKDGNVIE
ncbi:MAG: insulinase family protein, partial [Anaerolineae bacterium]|nr:insulinase family protein [Anaerolineae bacterium]